MLMPQKKKNQVVLKRRSKCTGGYSTIYVILITMALLIGFFSVLAVILQLKERSDAQRHMVLLSRNILASHDVWLMDAFAIPAYSPEVVESLVEKQLARTRFDASNVKVTPTKTIGDYRTLMDALSVAVQLHTATELGMDAIDGYLDPEVTRGMTMMMGRILKLDDGITIGGDAPANGHKVSRGNTATTGSGKSTLGSGKSTRGSGKGTGGGPNGASRGGDSDDGGEERARSLLKRFSELKETIRVSSEGMQKESVQVDDADWKLVDTVVINQYIMGVFSDRVTCKAHELEFFQNRKRSLHNGGAEVEEIIAGIGPNAVRIVQGRIFVMRWILNCAAMALDKPTMVRIEAAALAIPLPPPVSIGILIALESAIRAQLEVDKLLKGDGVPMPGLKSFASKSKTVAKNLEVLDFYYDDHLRVLLAFNSCGTNVSRVLTIIGDVYEADTKKPFDTSQLVMEHQVVFTLKGRGHLTMTDGYVYDFEGGGDKHEVQ